MGKIYNAEEAYEILINEDFNDIVSEDSLYCEIECNSSLVTYSEINSDPENDLSNRKILISKQDATTSAQCRPLNCGKGNNLRMYQCEKTWWKRSPKSQ